MRGVVVFASLLVMSSCFAGCLAKIAEEHQQNQENTSDDNRKEITGKVNLNEVFIGSGTDAAALDHPFNSVSWLANNLGRRRHNLHEGAIVLTGCVTESIWLNEGEQMVVEAENLGRVSVALRA